MSGTTTSSIVEQMSQLANTYIYTDFDDISRAQLVSDLNFLERLPRGSDHILRMMLGFASQLIPHFYSARGQIDANADRKHRFYAHMQKIRDICWEIRDTIDSL